MRNEIAVLRDLVSQMVSIREMSEELEESEREFIEKKIREIINKYEGGNN